jgi:hypothetical protein
MSLQPVTNDFGIHLVSGHTFVHKLSDWPLASLAFACCQVSRQLGGTLL